MAESRNGSVQNTPPQDTGGDTLGDIIRRERITRRITIETIAKDLKLNVRYVKALEANQFDALPADPYVRVYLRSIAKYLSLDPEQVLRKFHDAQGLPHHSAQTDAQTKLDVSKVEADKNYLPWVVVIVVIALLAALSFVATRRQWAPMGSAGKQALAAPDSATLAAASADTSQEVPELPPDSAVPAVSGVSTDSAARAAAVAAAPVDSPAVPDPTRKLVLTVRVVRDSTWIQVFSDGNSWKNTLRTGTKVFRAKDSLNVHVGNSDVAAFELNGRRLSKELPKSGVVVFKADARGRITAWTLAQWQSVFAGRL